jgi:hypothetical protein
MSYNYTVFDLDETPICHGFVQCSLVLLFLFIFVIVVILVIACCVWIIINTTHKINSCNNKENIKLLELV